MQNTTNLGLKKPDYTDFADIQDINDNMDALDEAIHDTQNSVATFTSSDVADGSATSWTAVTKVDSGETHKSIFAKMSQMFKNIRFLYKMLGTTDISAIGTGTVTNALSVLNANQTGSITESGTVSFEIIDGRYIKCGNVVFCSVRGEFKTNTSSGGALPLVRVPFNPSYPSTQFGVVSVATVSSADGARTIASTVTLAAAGSNYYAYQGVTKNLRASDVISMLWMYYV